MENLLKCNGQRFRCNIGKAPVEGRIRVEGNQVYLCQNVADGVDCEDKLGYKYSWFIENNPRVMGWNGITDFQLIPLTAEEIEAYKDWQVGDKLRDTTEGIGHGHDLEVIFRSGEFVVCKNVSTGLAEPNFTCDELHKLGYRLVAEPTPEEEIVEVTMDEIAEKLGVPVEQLRVKKQK